MAIDNHALRKRCGAAAKHRGGQPCQRWAMANGRCAVHGGLTPSGSASPHFKLGRYAQNMPQNLQDRYEAAMTDEALLDLRSEIAAVDVRLSQLAERIEPGISDTFFNAMDTIRSLIPALEDEQDEERQAALKRLKRIVTVMPRNDREAWDAFIDMIGIRKDLVESEHKRIKDLKAILSVEEAINYSTAMANAALKYIPEGEAQESYARDIARIFQINHPTQ